MKKGDFGLEIYHCDNGFVVKDSEGKLSPYQNDEYDEAEQTPTSGAVKLFWAIIDFFNLRPSGYARECIRVITEVGNKYVLKKGERLVTVHYQIVKTDDEVLKAMGSPIKEDE